MGPRVRVVTRIGSTSSPLQSYVMLSLFGHALFVAAMVILPSFRAKPAIPPDAFMVELVAPAPAPARTQTQATTPPPVTPPKQQVRPKPKENVSATTVKPETPKPLPEKIEPSPAATTPPRTVPTQQPYPGDSGTPIEDDPGVDVDVALEGDFQFAWYQASLKAAVYSQWRKPILEGIEDPREVRVTFEILRDGRIQNLRVEQSSGVRTLDRSALRAVSDAAPLPSLPRTWDASFLSAGFTFRLYPE